MQRFRWLAMLVGFAVLGFAHQALGLPPQLASWATGPPALSLLLLLPALAMLWSAPAGSAPASGADRAALRLLAAGIAAFAAGRLLRGVVPGAADEPLRVVADVVGLTAYPLLLAGVLAAARQHVGRIRLVATLDAATGCLAGAAFTCWAVTPLLRAPAPDAENAWVLVATAVGDAALVATALGAIGIATAAYRRRFVVLALGVLTFSVGDIGHSYRLVLGSADPHGWVAVTWLVGLTTVALGVGVVGEHREHEDLGHGPLLISSLGAVTAVVVLAAAPTWSQSALPSVLALVTLAGCAARFLLVFTELRELAVIRELALTDELTGIANRRSLYQHLDALFAPSEPDPHASNGEDPGRRAFALALIDLDHFKEVNDTLGHAAGDALLKEVTDRFAGALGELRTPHLLARLGGDEFAVVLHDVASLDAALIVGEALQAGLREPVRLDEAVLHVQASIGLALAPEHGEDRSDLLFAADSAMYTAKTAGSSVSLFVPVGTGRHRRQLEVAEDLFAAIEREELAIAYQPISTPALGLVAAEALVRWDHPRHGRVPAGDFLATAERYRLTTAIARRVLEVSLADLVGWRADGLAVTLSVNISATDLRDESIVDSVAGALLAHQLPADVLTVEVTEAAMMLDPERSRAVMGALDELGVRLSVDDYGSGHSSLQYLVDLPIDEIKLSRCFVAGLASQPRSRAIVASTIDLAHALGLRMVATGVEDRETLIALGQLGCDLVQGFHVGHPVPASDFPGAGTPGHRLSRLSPPTAQQ